MSKRLYLHAGAGQQTSPWGSGTTKSIQQGWLAEAWTEGKQGLQTKTGTNEIIYEEHAQ